EARSRAAVDRNRIGSRASGRGGCTSAFCRCTPKKTPGMSGRETRSGPGGCMRSSVGGPDADRRCPRLAPDWEEQASALSPAQGVLLSRIDGHTPWAVLREIGGLPPAEADAALAGWVAIGLVELDEDKPDPEPAR